MQRRGGGRVVGLLTKLRAVLAEVDGACLERETLLGDFVINKGLILDGDDVAIPFVLGRVLLEEWPNAGYNTVSFRLFRHVWYMVMVVGFNC